MALMSREWYYIISMYKSYLLTFFLILIGKFDQKSNFQRGWTKLGLIRAE